MANSLNLRAAEQTRLELTEAQQKEIERMYKRISKNIQKQASKLPNTTSGSLRGIYLEQLQKQINTELDNLSKDLESTIHKNMLSTSQAVVDGSNAFNKSVGISMEGMFSHVPKDVVKTVATGQLYEGNWTLSKSIWGHTAKTKKDINTVIAEGIAQNKSAYDIAKELEKYVNPSSQKPWDWSKVYPGTSKQVDYNAQRLARTMVSHAYQQSFVRTTQKNPFVTKYKWVSSNSARICELCASRDGVLFEKDELPLDHPNGMCTFVAVIPDSMVDIADRIADWALGKDDPDLDAYAVDLGYTPEQVKHSSAKTSGFKVYLQDAQKATEDFLSKMYGSISNIPSSQVQAVSDYGGDSYLAMNSLMRGKYKAGGTSLTKSQVKDRVKSLQQLMENSKLPENVTAFRGLPGKYVKSLKVGDTLSDKGFTSTSLDQDKALGFLWKSKSGVMLRVEAAQGTSAVPVTAINKIAKKHNWLDEAELLFDGSQDFVVTSINEVTLDHDVLSDWGRLLLPKGYVYTEITVRTK